MNWKIIFQLSIFGLIMALGTVSLIPEKTEPVFWIFIFSFCAYVIAKVCRNNFFSHGLITGIVNAVWITIVHLAFSRSYLANHFQFTSNIPQSFAVRPRLFMLITGPIFGVLFGIILGLFGLVASKLVAKNGINSLEP